MSLPVIDSVTPPIPSSLTPGQTFTFKIAAHSPDNKTGDADVPVSDAAGNVTHVQLHVVVVNPLTYGPPTTTAGTITQSPTDPTTFTLKV